MIIGNHRFVSPSALATCLLSGLVLAATASAQTLPDNPPPPLPDNPPPSIAMQITGKGFIDFDPLTAVGSTAIRLKLQTDPSTVSVGDPSVNTVRWDLFGDPNSPIGASEPIWSVILPVGCYQLRSQSLDTFDLVGLVCGASATRRDPGTDAVLANLNSFITGMSSTIKLDANGQGKASLEVINTGYSPAGRQNPCHMRLRMGALDGSARNAVDTKFRSQQ